MKFKTTAKCGGCSAAIIKAVSALAPARNWSVDLSSADKVLEYKGAVPADEDKFAQEVVKAVASVGHKAQRIG